MSTDFRHIGEIIHDVCIAPPSRAIVVHVPEHIPQIQLMFGKEPTAIFHFLDRFLGILAVRVGLPQSSEEFQSLLCRRRRPVHGNEALQVGHPHLVQDVGDSLMARMKRFKFFIGFGCLRVFSVKEESVTKRQFRFNRIRAEREVILELCIVLGGLRVILLLHGVIGAFVKLLSRIFWRRQKEIVNDATSRKKQETCGQH